MATETGTMRMCSWRTSNLPRGYCHGPSILWKYLWMESRDMERVCNEWVPRNDEDNGRHSVGMSVRQDGGTINCYNNQLNWGVGTSGVVVWLCCWELCCCCVRSWWKIWMVHPTMGNDSRVADELYLNRGCLALEDFRFCCLYWFSWIAEQVTTLKQLWLLFSLNLLKTYLEHLYSAF